MSNKQSKRNGYRVFLATPLGYLVSALVIWGVGFLLLLIAIRSGSLIEWLGVIIALIWGTSRLITAAKKL